MTAIEEARAVLPENHDGWGCDGSASICDRRVDALRALIAEYEGLVREMHQRELHHFETEKMLAEAGIDPDVPPSDDEREVQAQAALDSERLRQIAEWLRMEHGHEETAKRVDLIADRHDLLTDTVTELTTAGYDAKLVRRWRTHKLRAGDVIGVLETFDRSDGVLHRLEPWEHPDPFDRAGVYAETWSTDSARIMIHHGPHRVMLVDGRDVLVVKEPDLEAEAAHRRSVARLRTLARHDSLRVRVHDHDIALIDPLDNVVHEGDVASAFAWMLGIDLNTPITIGAA